MRITDYVEMEVRDPADVEHEQRVAELDALLTRCERGRVATFREGRAH
jgi:hypothetical protein